MWYWRVCRPVVEDSHHLYEEQDPDPHHFNADLDPAFHFNRIRVQLHFNADPDPAAYQDDPNLRPLVYRLFRPPFWASSPPFCASAVPFWASAVPFWALNFDFHADPDPAFHSNTDPDPASKHYADPNPGGLYGAKLSLKRLGVIADYALTLGDLIGVLYQFFKKLGIEQLRFKAHSQQ